MRSGLDVLREEGFKRLSGLRVGLLVHPASVDSSLRHAVSLFRDAPGVELARLFGPQHGIRGETQDNMIEWEGFTDPATGLEAVSLYGERRKPATEKLADLDALVIDLVDVGARPYTFVWTTQLCLEAAAEAGIRVVVLDRPNPVAPAGREGPVLDLAFKSFVGMSPVPLLHGLTAGEIAAFSNAALGIGAELSVVRAEGWRRSMWFDEAGLPFVFPSPNLPTLDSVLVYPGMVLLEGTNLSEGRGTTRPFEVFGAPFADPDALVRRLEAAGLPGVAFRPMFFRPTFQKWAGSVCGGAQIHVSDRGRFRPVRTAITVLSAFRELHPGDFAWKAPPYEYENEKLPIDILAGGGALRAAVDAGRDAAEIESSWADVLREFENGVSPHLLYE